MLTAERVSKRFGSVHALKEVSVDIPDGKLVALLGPSGSGKSSLGEILAGTLRPDAGRVLLDGVDVTRIPAHRRRVPLAPQEWDLFPHLTALENVEFGLRAAAVSRAECRNRSRELIARVGLSHRGRALPHELSGGEQQRVSAARALAAPSSYVIMDEPFANVDQETRRVLRSVVREAVAGRRGVLLITHDQADALMLADTVVCLDRGRVLMAGTPGEVYWSPKSLEAARLVGDAFALPLQSARTSRESETVEVAPLPVRPETARPVGHRGTAICRPEWLEVVHDGALAHALGTVIGQTYHGDHYRIELRSETAVLRLESVSPCEPGSTLRVRVRPGILLPIEGDQG